MKLGQTSVIYLGAKVLGSVLSFVAIIYFTRTLGEEIYGYYAIAIAVVSWLSIIKSVGLSKAITKRMSEGDEPYAYLIAGTVIKLIIVIPLVGGVLLFQDPVNDYVGQPVAELVALLLLISILSSMVNSALNGTHRVHIYAPLSTLKDIGRYSIMVALVFLGWGLTGMLFGYAVGTFIVSLIGFLFIKPSLVVPNREHIKSLFDFTKYSWLGNMRKRTFSDMDILVLGLFVPAGLTGIYAVTYALGKFLDIFGSAISATLFPEMSKLSSNNDNEKVGTLMESALSYSGLFLIPGVVGGAVIGDRLMRIYGPSFEQGAGVLVMLLVALVIYTYNKQFLTTLDAIDRPDLAFRVNGIFIFSNVILNFVLVWQIGWMGAAIATATSACIGLFASLYYVRRVINFQFPYLEVGREWFAAIVMGLVLYPARSVAEGHSIGSQNEIFVALLIFLGASIYFLILFAISPQFREITERNTSYQLKKIYKL